MNFLQEHYNRWREGFGSHEEYVIWNDIGDDVARELKEEYDNPSEDQDPA